jgi:hypothetical protein
MITGWLDHVEDLEGAVDYSFGKADNGEALGLPAHPVTDPGTEPWSGLQIRDPPSS